MSNTKLSCLGAVKRNNSSSRPQVKTYALASGCFDRSGSMENMAEQASVAFFNLIKDSKENAEKNNISLSLTASSFDDITTIIFDNEDVKNISLTHEEARNHLKPRGCTRLYATGIEEVNKLRENFKRLKRQHPEAKCTASFLLFTDGIDNSSQGITKGDLSEAISAARDEGIVCLFTGADQEATNIGASYGFRPSNCLRMSSLRRTSAESGFRATSAALQRGISGGNAAFTQAERQSSMGMSDDDSDDNISSPSSSVRIPAVNRVRRMLRMPHTPIPSLRTSAAPVPTLRSSGEPHSVDRFFG